MDSVYENNYCKKSKIVRKYYLSQILLFGASSLFNPILYLYLSDRGVNVSIIGIFLSLYCIMSAICEIPFGIFTDRFYTTYTMIISVLIKIFTLFFLIYRISTASILISGFYLGFQKMLLLDV